MLIDENKNGTQAVGVAIHAALLVVELEQVCVMSLHVKSAYDTHEAPLVESSVK